MRLAVEFRPQLTRKEAEACAARYMAQTDDGAMEAGRRIKAGEFSRTHLATIYEWKTKNRGKARLGFNTDAEIKDALRLAATAEVPRSAIAVLRGLYGVDTPVASAIATVIHPDVFTILDFRALEALGNASLDRSLPFYLAYLDFCTNLAKAWKMPLRTLDRALWQWSSDQSQKTTASALTRMR